MTIAALLTLLRALRDETDPLTGEPVRPDSALADHETKRGIARLIQDITDRDTPVPTITVAEITALRDALCELDYQPTVEQLDKVFRGSRSIADPRLRGLPAYRRYRSVLTRKQVREMLVPHTALITGTEVTAAPKTRAAAAKPWRDIDFFTTDAFDKLTDDKATELYREVQALGLQKPTDRLPAYMARARKNIPRSFEPWTREERALLIEAMCYTNHSEAGVHLRAFGLSGAERG